MRSCEYERFVICQITLRIALDFSYQDGYLCWVQGLAMRGPEGDAPHEACTYCPGSVRGKGVEKVFAWSAPAGRTVFDPEQRTGQVGQASGEVLPYDLGGQIA